MPKKNGAVTSPSEMEAQAKRLEEAAKRKKAALAQVAEANAIESEMTADTQEEEIQSPKELRTLSKIEQVLSEINGDGSFTVFHLAANTESQVGKYDIEEWPNRMELIAKEKGGGDFKVVFRDGEGHYMGQVTRTFDRTAYGGGKSESSSGGDATMRFMEMMQARDEVHRREMDAMRLENQRMMLEQQKMMIEMVKSQNQPFVKSANEIAVIGEMFSKKSPDVLGLIREGLGLLREWREDVNEPAPSDPLTMMIDKVFKVLTPVLQAGVAKLAVPPAPVAAPSPALPAPVTPTPAAQVVPSSPPAAASAAPAVYSNAHIKDYAAKLKASILSGAKADAIALFVLDNMEDADVPGLKAFADDPGIVGQFLEADKELVQHQAWLAQFFQVLREELQEDQNAVPEPAASARSV
jgi:hypothetical protein